jgi:hypothetical protein
LLRTAGGRPQSPKNVCAGPLPGPVSASDGSMRKYTAVAGKARAMELQSNERQRTRLELMPDVAATTGQPTGQEAPDGRTTQRLGKAAGPLYSWDFSVLSASGRVALETASHAADGGLLDAPSTNPHHHSSSAVNTPHRLLLVSSSSHISRQFRIDSAPIPCSVRAFVTAFYLSAWYLCAAVARWQRAASRAAVNVGASASEPLAK